MVVCLKSSITAAAGGAAAGAGAGAAAEATAATTAATTTTAAATTATAARTAAAAGAAARTAAARTATAAARTATARTAAEAGAGATAANTTAAATARTTRRAVRFHSRTRATVLKQKNRNEMGVSRAEAGTTDQDRVIKFAPRLMEGDVQRRKRSCDANIRGWVRQVAWRDGLS